MCAGVGPTYGCGHANDYSLVQRTATTAVVELCPGSILGDGFQLLIGLAEIHVPRMWVEEDEKEHHVRREGGRGGGSKRGRRGGRKGGFQYVTLDLIMLHVMASCDPAGMHADLLSGV